MCTVCNRWRFLILRSVPSRKTTWILFFDEFFDLIPSGGSVVTIASDLSFSDSPLLPAPSRLDALLTGLRAPSFPRYLPHETPRDEERRRRADPPSFPLGYKFVSGDPGSAGTQNDAPIDGTKTNRTNRTTAPGTDRSVLRKGRLQQITTTGKEGCGTRGDTVPAERRRTQASILENRRSPCRKEF